MLSTSAPSLSRAEAVLRLAARPAIRSLASVSPVTLAVRDLELDFARVLPHAPALREAETGPAFTVQIDPALGGTEKWAIAIDSAGVDIRGSDALGAVYGVYEFSRRFLGVDPLWYWKDLEPESLDALELPFGEWRSVPARFAYRGWFLNDEDLLTGWQDEAAPRRLDYPFYQRVVPPAVIDRVCEALLRSGGNLIIPASFVNILEPAERALVETAVARGLHVTQHHIETLGLSHFAYELYWRDRGEKRTFSYATDRERALFLWRDYAREWVRVAGDRVVWQIGLRGRGDRPVWHHDPAITEQRAGAFISQALAEQVAIIREVDPRPAPPITVTLWEEGSHLMAAGHLRVPEGVTAVFCDRGASQTMQEDFYQCPREPGRPYGVYYHLAYWGSGPHLAEGVPVAKIARVLGQVVSKGDTAYCLVNVANVREFTVGLGALMQLVTTGPESWSAERYLAETLPGPLAALYRRYHAAILDLRLGEHHAVIKTRDLDPRSLCDGEARQFIHQLVCTHREPGRPFPPHMLPVGCSDLTEAARELLRAAAEFRRVAHDADALLASGAVARRFESFVRARFVVQSHIMAALYACSSELIAALESPARLPLAAQILEEAVVARSAAEHGRWRHWYRGEHKSDLRKAARDIRALAKPAPVPA